MNHTHSYIKWKKTKSGEIWFKCADPNCTHTAPASLIKGKVTLCPQCKVTEFILDREALRRAVPKCVNCRDTKEAKLIKAAEGLMGNVEMEVARELLEGGILDEPTEERVPDENNL